MKLYELTDSYLQVLELISEGEDYADTLESISEAIEDKAENMAKLIKSIEAQAEAVSTERKRLQDRETHLNNQAKNIKAYLQAQMELTNQKKIKGTLFSVGIQKNAPSVDITDESKVPGTFLIPQNPKIDRNALKDFLKENDVEWARLKQTESIRIR